MTNDKTIEYLNDVRNGIHIPAPGIERPLLNDKEKEAVDLAISALKKQEAIKSCTPPSDDWEHYADRLHDIAYQYGYEQGKRDAKQDRWIPVTDRLPEYGTEVLTQLSDNDIVVNWVIDEEDGEWFEYGVVAWRPLPELYEGI